ncbi:oxalate/formate antiporter [Aspergillus nomiae NRRL 13137]|uniref:Oxalate/formate antiporter n=1 Tax=Aspergillus nomiae NRRL (strain ATCC 15546 / NRRL 13137 / CBS 260.88 / M93) TaxID=1509407 RepID=A0A0L1IZU4_ASPN3|nr:oxalate/formate antiporter [Aspergillus nomiae NRRL 13137]KNG84693.1 oxalate/formate antiporter [Aspergillus nomiae NRRL 13137]
MSQPLFDALVNGYNQEEKNNFSHQQTPFYPCVYTAQYPKEPPASGILIDEKLKSFDADFIELGGKLRHERKMKIVKWYTQHWKDARSFEYPLLFAVPLDLEMLSKEDRSVAPSRTSESPELANNESYPEGGLRAWLVVFGAWCAMIPSMGLLNSLGILHAWTSTHQLQGYSESSIGWIYGAYGFFLYFAGAQAGPIFDAYGPAYVIIPGSIGMVAALICFSCSEEYYQIFLSFSVLGGISACTLFTPAVSCVGHWFNVRRGYATGIACTAGGLGGVIFPLIVLFAAPKIGFPWAIRIIALLCAVLCTLACLLMKTRLPRNKTAGGGSIDFKALKDIKYATTTAAVFLVEFAVFIPITYIASYAVHVGVDNTMSYAQIIFLNLGAIPGRFLPGLIADRLGRFNVMVLTSLLCAVLTLALWLTAADNLAAIICYAVLFGFWSGAAISLTPVCISQVCATEDYGKRNGTTFTIVSVGTLTGIPIAGAYNSTMQGITGGLSCSGACFIWRLLLLLLLRGAFVRGGL